MPVWITLISREAALLAILAALGSAPSTLLPQRFDSASRIALAPLLGFCLGTCVATTLLEFFPTNHTYWVILALAVGSIAATGMRLRSQREPRAHLFPSARDLAGLLVVIVAVVGPTTYVLNARHSDGPTAYYFTDVDNYVAVQDGARTESLSAARDRYRAYAATGRGFANRTQLTWSFFADFGSNLDATPLDSNVNALLGLGADQTYGPFLLVLLLSGALGAFASVRYLARRATAGAALAGSLFGGSMFLELYFDSFQAAIVAIGLVVPFLLLVDGAIARHRRRDLALVALLLGAMVSVYPLYIAPIAAAAGLRLIVEGIRHRRRGEAVRPVVVPVLGAIIATVALASVLDVIGVIRDIHYYRLLLEHKVPLPRVGFHLAPTVLPGWIAQTREFWNMPPLSTGGLKQLVLAVIIPVGFAAVAAVGVVRHRGTLMLLGLAGIFCVLAEYAYASQQNCTYCGERNLLPLTPIAAVLIGVGISALTALPWRRIGLASAVVATALIVGFVGQRARIELYRFADGSYFMGSAERTVLGHLPAGQPVLEEGFGASVFAQAEQPLVYHLLNEADPGHVSIALGSNLGNAVQYLASDGADVPPGPELNPAYRFVLTRLGGVTTDRLVIARSGPVALEKRVRALDVSPYAGLSVSFQRIPGSGIAWVQTQYPLELHVVGDSGAARAWARLTFHADTPISLPPQPGVHSRAFGRTLVACVPATGRPPVRKASLRVTAALSAGPLAPELFPPPMPLEGIALTGMQAVSGRCNA